MSFSKRVSLTFSQRLSLPGWSFLCFSIGSIHGRFSPIVGSCTGWGEPFCDKIKSFLGRWD